MKMLTDLKELLEIVFLTDVKDFLYSSKVKKLRDVEWEFFKRYWSKLSPFYIFKQRQNYDYQKSNFYFGEMSYPTAEKIAEIAGITKKDAVFDLGCGRGKFLFFTALYTGARCVGIDLLPIYITNAVEIAEKLQIPRLDFFQKDMLKVDISNASVVFIHGTTFSQQVHWELAEKVETMKSGSRLISVSVKYKNPRLELFEKKKMLLGWGRTAVMFYRVR